MEGARLNAAMLKAMSPIAAIAAMAHGRKAQRVDAEDFAGTAVAGASAISMRRSLTSWMVWKRSSGSLARQVVIRRLSAGEVLGASEVIGGGSLARMEPMMLAWVLPSKARLPVAIS